MMRLALLAPLVALLAVTALPERAATDERFEAAALRERTTAMASWIARVVVIVALPRVRAGWVMPDTAPLPGR